MRTTGSVVKGRPLSLIHLLNTLEIRKKGAGVISHDFIFTKRIERG